MLNTNKLLYILPDVAYAVELLPAKKPHSFTIHSFRQINGQFIEKDELVPQKVAELFGKLKADEYQLILPDSLFTNTIVSVKEKSDSKIKKHLKETLFPELGLNADSHQVEGFVLTQLKDESKVQLSAIEHSVLTPLKVGASENKIKISHLSPLSWTLKSIISLEPSISVVQMGQMLYSSFHYIGIDQTNQASLDDIDVIAQTIKTLKGAEPSVQTIYLVTDESVEKKLDQLVDDKIPLQQLAEAKTSQPDLPGFVQKILESGMKTLVIKEYPVPRFDLPKASPEEIEEYSTLLTDDDKKLNKTNADDDKTPAKTKTETKTDDDQTAPDKTDTDDDEKLDDEDDQPNLPEEKSEPKLEPPTPIPTLSAEAQESKAQEKTDHQQEPAADADDEEDDVDLTKFAHHQDQEIDGDSAAPTSLTQKKADDQRNISTTTPAQNSDKTNKKVIKNTSGVKAMLKMIVLVAGAFVVTITLGIGIGLGVLRFTERGVDEEITTPVVITDLEEETQIEKSPEPEPVVEIDKSQLSILVVNATTRAGYAGTIRDRLDEAGFGSVTATNASGDYTPGLYVLLDEDDSQLIEVLSEDTELNLVYDSELDKSIEDTQDQYDIVIVLGE